MLPRQGQVKGVHHHQAIIIWNVKGTYLRKTRRSKVWIIKWQKIHIYQQFNLKRQTKQTRGTETESWLWRVFWWLSAGMGEGWRGEGIKK